MDRKPGGLDWDRWLGPGPKVPWNPNIYFSPYKWLHDDGGIHFYNDGCDTPDTVALILEYPQNLTLTVEAECLTAPGLKTTAGVE